MSGSSPEKDPSPKQKPDETQAETTRIQATHTPKSKDESPDQNQQSQCQLRRPQQSESKRKRKRTHTGQSSEERRITSPDAVVYKPNQSDEEPQEKARAKSQKYAIPLGAFRPLEKRSEWMEEKFTYPPEYFLSQNQQNPPQYSQSQNQQNPPQYSQSQNQQNNIQEGPASANGVFRYSGSRPPFFKSEWMEERRFTFPPEYSQSQNQQNNIQAGPASANGPSQPGGSNPVQGNPPSRMRSRVKRFSYFFSPLGKRSEWMEERFTHPPEYSQSQNQQNNIQAGPASANGPSQAGGSNQVQGNPPSRLGRRVTRLLCLRN